MIKKEIEIDVNAGSAEKEIKDLIKDFEKLDKTVENVGKEGAKALDKIEKNTKETEKSTKSLSEGFKATGLALKAMGIGLVVSALATLKEVFMGNQKVADTFATVMGTVSNVFSQVTNVIVSVIEKVSASSNGFKGLTNVISGLMTLGLTPLKAAFFGIKLVIDEVRLAWEESLFGDGDPKTIKDLTKRIEETKTSLKKVGTDAVDAGKKVVTNIGDAISEVGAVVEGTIDGVSKISVKSAYEQAKANVQLQNTAKLAEANQARLVEQYDRQAEKLRQTRDEERNSIEDRIKANNKLRDVLNNQEKAMLGQADAQIAAARATLSQNNNIENQVALTNALANREGVLAQIEGLRSEQKANDLALNKELLDLTKSKQEAETQLAIDQKLFNAERLKDEEASLIAQKEALEFSKQLELERLQNLINSTNEGTQARIDAENEYAAKKQEIENNILTKEDELNTYRFNKQIEQQKLLADNEQLSFEARLLALQEQDRIITESKAISEAERTKMLEENAKARKAIGDAEVEAQKKNIEAVSNLLGNLAGFLGESTAAGKAAAVAQATISTYQSAVQSYNSLSGIPIVGPALGGVAAGLAVASGIANVKKILSVKVPNSSGGGGGGTAPSATTAAAPQFNVVGNSGVNQLASTLGQQTQQPVQAFVVANQVTTQQALDRNIVNNASLG